MWVRTVSREYKGVSREDIWKIWVDINNYASWHSDLDYCKFDGEFKVGNYFRLKPKNAPEVKVFLTEIIEGKKFVDCTSFFGAKMFDTHEVEDTKDGVKITNTVSVSGFLRFLWIGLVAKNVANSAPHEMDAVVALAKAKYE